MNKLIALIILTTISGCALGSDPTPLATNSVDDVMVPGRVIIQLLSVPVCPIYSGTVNVHVCGTATNFDRAAAHSLTIELGRATIAPDFDALRYVYVPADGNVSFELNMSYVLPAGCQWDELVYLGSDAENQVQVDSLKMTVEEN